MKKARYTDAQPSARMLEHRQAAANPPRVRRLIPIAEVSLFDPIAQAHEPVVAHPTSAVERAAARVVHERALQVRSRKIRRPCRSGQTRCASARAPARFRTWWTLSSRTTRHPRLPDLLGFSLSAWQSDRALQLMVDVAHKRSPGDHRPRATLGAHRQLGVPPRERHHPQGPAHVRGQNGSDKRRAGRRRATGCRQPSFGRSTV